MPSVASAVARAQRERDFRAGRDDDRALRRRRRRSRRARSRRARSPRSARRRASANGTFCRVKQQARRAVAALDRRGPRDRGLDGVARAPDVHVRDQAQARRVLDRLVRRPVLAEADRIVREHEDRAQLHQRRHAQRVARVVGEREERARRTE